MNSVPGHEQSTPQPSYVCGSQQRLSQKLPTTHPCPGQRRLCVCQCFPDGSLRSPGRLSTCSSPHFLLESLREAAAASHWDLKLFTWFNGLNWLLRGLLPTSPNCPGLDALHERQQPGHAEERTRPGRPGLYLMLCYEPAPVLFPLSGCQFLLFIK